jgi:hypothetical protein
MIAKAAPLVHGEIDVLILQAPGALARCKGRALAQQRAGLAVRRRYMSGPGWRRFDARSGPRHLRGRLGACASWEWTWELTDGHDSVLTLVSREENHDDSEGAC